MCCVHQLSVLWTQWTSTPSRVVRVVSCGLSVIHPSASRASETFSSRTWIRASITRLFTIRSRHLEASCLARYSGTCRLILQSVVIVWCIAFAWEGRNSLYASHCCCRQNYKRKPCGKQICTQFPVMGVGTGWIWKWSAFCSGIVVFFLFLYH